MEQLKIASEIFVLLFLLLWANSDTKHAIMKGGLHSLSDEIIRVNLHEDTNKVEFYHIEEFNWMTANAKI